MVKTEYHISNCIQCGRCAGACPVSTKSSLNVRKLVFAEQESLLRPGDLPQLGIWECTACTTCNLRCPKNVNPAYLVTALRSRLVEGGRMAVSIQTALESTFLQGNPWSRAREKRMGWADGLSIRILKPGERVNTLLFVCCTACYDERGQKTARALVTILQSAGVDFGVLGEEESCCCSEQRRLGEEGLFEEMSRQNTEKLNSVRSERIVTLSPHCFNALKNDYTGLVSPVMHYTQLLAELLEQGKLRIRHKLEESVTYHDPCFLGKQNKVFAEPRKLLHALADELFVEYDRSAETSLCCEGGGGRMWVESEGKERLAEIRVRDALALPARIIATACPFCTSTLEDAVRTTNSEQLVRIADLAELIAPAL